LDIQQPRIQRTKIQKQPKLKEKKLKQYSEEIDEMAQLNSSENSSLSLRQKDSVTRSIRECVSFCDKILVEEKSEARSV
jgi:DNA topoisomerase IB